MPKIPEILIKITEPYIKNLGFIGLKYMGIYESAQIWLLEPPRNKIYGTPIIYSYLKGDAKKILGRKAIAVLSSIS